MVAANAVTTASEGDLTQVRQQVAEMLRWMATTDSTGSDFGQGASELARGLSATAEGHEGGAPDATPGATHGNDANDQPGSTPKGAGGSDSGSQPTTTTDGHPGDGSSGKPGSVPNATTVTTSGGQSTPPANSQPSDSPVGQGENGSSGQTQGAGRP